MFEYDRKASSVLFIQLDLTSGLLGSFFFRAQL